MACSEVLAASSNNHPCLVPFRRQLARSLIVEASKSIANDLFADFVSDSSTRRLKADTYSRGSAIKVKN